MQTNYAKIIDAKDAMFNLAQEHLPAKQAIDLARLIKKLEAEIALFDEQRLKICREYGTLTDDGQDFQIDDDKRAAFSQAINDLLALDVTIDGDPVHVTVETISASTVIKTDGFVEFD